MKKFDKKIPLLSGLREIWVYSTVKVPYDFLEKDSMVQCEEIRAVSKSRLDVSRGCIGMLTPEDFEMVKGKFKRAYNL